MNEEQFSYVIEVAGTCNLKCPSCPMVHQREKHCLDGEATQKGIMSIEKFGGILEKVKEDNVAKTILIILYDWGESTLNTHLPDVIRMVRDYGFYPFLSSNFSLEDISIRGIVSSYPHFFEASLSGYHNEVYRRMRNNGDSRMVMSSL